MLHLRKIKGKSQGIRGCLNFIFVCSKFRNMDVNPPPAPASGGHPAPNLSPKEKGFVFYPPLAGAGGGLL
jgi:hypothetical protein